MRLRLGKDASDVTRAKRTNVRDTQQKCAVEGVGG